MGRKTVLALLCAVCSFGATTPVLATTTVTQYTYDAGDNVTTVTDPRGLVTAYSYDGLGQLWGVSSPDTGTTTANYDSYGRRISLTRADNVTTTYGYDAINRTISITAGGQTQSFAYDSCTNGLGLLCSVSDATGTTAYTYTPEGWVAGRGFSINGTGYSLGYGYDAVGHLAAVTYPDGHQAIYNYSNGAVSGITFKIGTTQLTAASGVTWGPMNAALANWTSSNGLTNTLSYDTDSRLTAISTSGVEGLGFSYDAADRLTNINNVLDGTLSQYFGYDDESRLVSMYSLNQGASYGYDANGNRIAAVQGGASSNAYYGATSNQIVNTTGANPQAYGYDALGNITTLGGVTAYQYDAFNRMNMAGGTSYYINPEGQRLRKGSGSSASYFAPDTSGPLLAEYSNGAWINYVWLGGRLIGREVNGQLEAIGVDQVGRPQVVTNASQTVVWSAQNWPFTRSVVLSSSTPLNLGFPGQYYDAETGLWNNGFRDYDPALGRYVESDPIGLTAGTNTYAYVGGNPLSYVDPLGLYCLKDWQIKGAAGAIVGGVAGGIAGARAGGGLYGAAISAAAGALVNGGLGAVDGLTKSTQAAGAATGSAGALVSSGTKVDMASGLYGGAVGGVVAAEVERRGYPRSFALGSGGLTGGAAGAAISGYLSGLTPSAVLKSGMKGGLLGAAMGIGQGVTEAALRAGNNCGCGQ